MELENYIIEIADRNLQTLSKSGYIPGGHNGPYYDYETPVRNTAHWATIFAHCYKTTDDKKYYDAAKKCGQYLLSQDARPMNATFYCRTNPKKDFSNGLIGQAWAIEGLISAYQLSNDKKLIDTAKKVFLFHPFDEKYQLWRIVNVDGSHNTFDMTFNHQLWFAASGFLLLSVTNDDEISRQCHLFMNDIENTLRTYNNGLIKHGLLNRISIKDKIKDTINLCSYQLKKLINGKDTRYKENGYHLFNMYAFALIRSLGNEFEIYNSPQLKASLNYCFDEKLHQWFDEENIESDFHVMKGLKNTKLNIYGYSYNAPGFELPYIYLQFKEMLSDKTETVNQIIKKQIDYTFDTEKQSFCKNTEDSNTLNARLYEYVRCLT